MDLAEVLSHSAESPALSDTFCLKPGEDLNVDRLTARKSAFVFLVDHSSGHSGSQHQGCCALQVSRGAEKPPHHRNLHWRELMPEVVL